MAEVVEVAEAKDVKSRRQKEENSPNTLPQRVIGG